MERPPRIAVLVVSSDRVGCSTFKTSANVHSLWLKSLSRYRECSPASGRCPQFAMRGKETQSLASGSRTSKRAPVGRLCADSVPRCACTRPAAIASPSPDPLGSDESARGTRLLDPR